MKGRGGKGGKQLLDDRKEKRRSWKLKGKHYIACGVRGGAVGSDTALQAGRSGDRFSMVSLEFFIGIILPAALWP